MIAFFFVFSALAAGFGVADTHVLFGLAPEHEPTPTLVVADVTTSLAYGARALRGGRRARSAISTGTDATTAYRGLFASRRW